MQMYLEMSNVTSTFTKKHEKNLKRRLSISYFAFEDKCPTAMSKKVLQDRIKYIPARNGIKTMKNSIRNSGHENTYKITLGRREFKLSV